MRVPNSVYLFLAAGIAAASQSGNIVRLGDAHPVVMAGFRLMIASLLLTPIAYPRFSEYKKMTRVEIGLLVGAGVAMAVHFFTWIAAVQRTSVANAATFYSVTPVLTALAEYLIFKEKLGLRLIVSIGLGLGGVAVIGLDDLSLTPENLVGDGWALLCAVLGTLYFLLGKRLRRILSTPAYAFSVYGIAGMVSFAVAILWGLELVNYSPRTWLCFVLLALVPTLIGHTSFNHALRYVQASWITTMSLSEPLFAGLVAFFVWNEPVTFQMALGYVLIVGSVLLITVRKSSPSPSNSID